MLKKIIKIIALITVFLLPIQFALSDELILPKKKTCSFRWDYKRKDYQGWNCSIKKTLTRRRGTNNQKGRGQETKNNKNNWWGNYTKK